MGLHTSEDYMEKCLRDMWDKGEDAIENRESFDKQGLDMNYKELAL